MKLLAIAAALVLSMVVGCHFGSRGPLITDTAEVPMEEVLKQSVINQSITLGADRTLTLKLGSNYTTPYRWTPNTKIGDSAIIKQISHKYVQPNSQAMGAPGTEVWTFTALRSGTTTISTSYRSFVGSDARPACTYSLDVTVR